MLIYFVAHELKFSFMYGWGNRVGPWIWPHAQALSSCSTFGATTWEPKFWTISQEWLWTKRLRKYPSITSHLSSYWSITSSFINSCFYVLWWPKQLNRIFHILMSLNVNPVYPLSALDFHVVLCQIARIHNLYKKKCGTLKGGYAIFKNH